MSEEMVIFTRTYDFISWLLPLAQNFPRSQRFLVTQRLLNAVFDFQELLIEANAERAAPRVEKLRAADVALRKVRLYLRLSRKWDWIKEGQYRYASAMIVEIGRLLGGWKKAS